LADSRWFGRSQAALRWGDAQTTPAVGAAHDAPIIHSTARVKGPVLAARFFCGGFPFFAPQKNQKNRGNCAKISQDCGLDTWVNETSCLFGSISLKLFGAPRTRTAGS
jgi:hypothetical protein